MNTASGQRGDGAPFLPPLTRIFRGDIRAANAGAHFRATELNWEPWSAGTRTQVIAASCRAHYVFGPRQCYQLPLKIFGVVPGISQRLPGADQNQLGTRIDIALKPFARRGLYYSGSRPS